MEHRLRLGIALVLAAGASGCSKENTVDASTQVEGAIGLQCSENDDCGTSGVCALGYCRLGCATDAECPQGALCIGDAPPYGCQLPQDAVCSSAQPCKAPLVCGLDKTCRMPCKVSKDCPRNDQECYAGVCVGDAEKSEAAAAYRSCTDGSRRCSDPTCEGSGCSVEGCNEAAPGWQVVESCLGANRFCTAGRCFNGEEDPGLMVLIQAPQGGSYSIGQTEVTQAQYAKFLAEKEGDLSGQPAICSFNTTFVPLSPWPPLTRFDYPVTSVDWCDAYAYCKWAGRRLCGRIGGGPGTIGELGSSQWYNACSSGNTNSYPYGNAYSPDTCNTSNGDQLVAVGILPGCASTVPGYEGVFDLSGNAGEWEDACEIPPGDSNPDHWVCSIRGSSAVGGSAATCADFPAIEPTSQERLTGFRCCSDP